MASTTDILNPCDQAFEDRYQRSASDPHNAEMLSVWRDAWAASRLQQGYAEMRAVVAAARAWYHTGWGKDQAAHELAMAVLHLEQADAARQSSAGGEGQA